MGRLAFALVLVVAALAAPAPTHAAGVLLPHALFSDNMVLQKGQQNWITGTAASNVKVTVTFDPPYDPAHTAASDVSAGDGSFKISLPAYTPPSGSEGKLFTFTLQAQDAVRVAQNVSFGTVLLCSGQSNMALNLMPVYNSTAIINAAHHPEIRLFFVPYQPQPTPQTNVSVPVAWQQTTPQTVRTFSAICYLTALWMQQLHGTVGREVFGLVDSSKGSTDVQQWMSAASRHKALSCWNPPSQPPPAALPPSSKDNATWLYNGMIAPLSQYAYAAVLWDQGENNAHYCSVHQYNCLFSTMMADWRTLWPSVTVPFVFVQLGGYDDRGNVSTIRFAQSDSLPADETWYNNHSATRLPTEHSAIAPTYDLGSPMPGNPKMHWWIHCRNKTEVGRRVALQLRQLLTPPATGNSQTQSKQQQQQLPLAPELKAAGHGPAGTDTYSGPIVQHAVLNAAATHLPHVIVAFDFDDSLHIAPAQGCIDCCNQTGVFQVANARGKWFDAQAEVTLLPTSYKAVLNITAVDVPVRGPWIHAVRYAVLDIPQCVLYNGAQLPAVPFQLPVPYTRGQ